jgi:hypothetical protein
MLPSSCPVATRQQLVRNVMHEISDSGGLSMTVVTCISFASHSLIVLSRLHEISFGSSGIRSPFCWLSRCGSSEISLRMGPWCPETSAYF